MAVAEWVKAFTEKHFGEAPFKIGDIVRHPKHGKVLIVDGRYWGEHGISNWWSWRKVGVDGKPYGRTLSGYGFKPGRIRK